MKQTVGFLGLGNMGSPMAERLAADGHLIYVYDPREDVVASWVKRGGRACLSPRDMADQVEVIFLSLPTPDIVSDVVCGSAGIVNGSTVKLVIDLSTTGPDVSRSIGGVLASKGVGFIDAPVSGGVAGAKAGTLAIMVSAPSDHLELGKPFLEKLGRVFHLGTEPGLGQLAKLLNNLLSGGAMALAAEAATMGVRAGLDAKPLIDVFNAGSGRSSATLDKYPKAVLPGTFNLGFTSGLMLKDITLCLAQAEAMGIDLPTSKVVLEQWRRAVGELGPDSDFSRMMQLAEKDLGVEVRESSAEIKMASAGCT